MFAIMNIKTNKFVYGTDYRYFPPHQRTSKNQMLTFADKEWAFCELKRRKCGKDYRVVVLKTVEVKRVLEVNDMASARKCDRCGKLYEYYDKTDMGKINGMAFIVKDDTFGSYRVQDYDLCPDCMNELIEWVERGEKNGN